MRTRLFRWFNQLAQQFETVVLTQDWHPEQHISFAENHKDKVPFETVELTYGTQVLWPKHCVQGSHDAEFHPDLDVPTAQLIIRKGFHADIDSYSAFYGGWPENANRPNGYLKEHQVDTVYVVGIATDFCVAWTALDAVDFGFNTYVIEDACKAIDLNGSLEQAWLEMSAQGVQRIQSSELLSQTWDG